MSEKEIKGRFFVVAQRFLSPLWQAPAVTLRTVLRYTLSGVSPVIHIIFIQQIVKQFSSGEREGFITLMFLYIIYNIVYEILEFSMRKWSWVENVNAYRNAIDALYFPKFLKVSNTEVEKLGTGKLVSLITTGTDKWALSFDTLLFEISRIIFVFLYGCYMFFQLGFIFGILFLFLYVGVLYVGNIFNKKSLEYRRKRSLIWHEYIRGCVKIIMSKLEIIQSNRGSREIQKIADISNSLTQVNRDMALWVHLCYRVAESSVIIVKISIVLYVGLGVFDGIYSLAFFVGFFAVLSIMESTITQTMQFYRNFTKDFTDIERLWDFFDTTPEIQGYETGNIFEYKAGNIQLQDLSYSYESNKHIFQDFHLEITGGKVTAFVGPSGGGKTTLVKLIAGYLKANSGEILIDEQKLSEISLKSYYQDVGYLTQEPSVFDGTVRENLMYALQPLSLIKGEDSGESFESHLQHILILARCEFVYDLPNGLDTEIGERGVKLSGGQKQRLAIAKIFLKNPKIIILDEPTSALDSQSEKAITQAMHQLFKDRTVLVIAHRLQTVKYADEIIVIDSGKIIERGSHENLVKNKGYYAEMLELQSGF